MIHVRFDPEQLEGELKDWWQDWSQRAKKAKARAIADGPDHVYSDAIWRDLKKWLLEHVFHNKCAYCESRMGVTDPGDAEHFRPKGKVTHLDSAGRCLEALVNGKPHPGYYWLVYDWENLVPACSECNTIGKANHFPVAKTWVLAPDPQRCNPRDLDPVEEPELLHPYFDQPHMHLHFTEFGTVGPKDRRGDISAKVYNLHREPLKTSRSEAIERFLLKIGYAFPAGSEAISKLLKPYREGREPYSRAILDAYRSRLNELSQLELDDPGT